MFTIKWDGDYTSHMVTFEDGWQRLNSCNAATFERTFTSKGKTYSLYYLQSYATPIMYIVKVVDKYGRLSDCRVYVNADMWNCSHTTITHIRRYCHNLLFFHDVPIDYYDVRDGMKHLEKYSNETEFKPQDRVRIIADSDDALRYLFEINCPRVF